MLQAHRTGAPRIYFILSVQDRAFLKYKQERNCLKERGGVILITVARSTKLNKYAFRKKYQKIL